MSLKKIAALTGASVSTVSRVLNDSGYHCREKGLEEKIWAAAKKLSYLPNSAARQLRMGGTDTKDVRKDAFTIDIFLTRFDSLKQDAFFYELYLILKEELMANGIYLGEILSSYDILALSHASINKKAVPYRTHHAIQTEKQGNQTAFIEQKKNTGLFIFGKCPDSFISILKKRYTHIVGIDRNPTDYEYDEVICNGTTAAEKAMEYLISLGHKQIAYIGDCTLESRYTGYYQALLNHRIPLSHDNIYPTGQTREEGEASMRAILQKTNPPTAIFCANDVTALGVLSVLRKKHKKGYLPSVISIDNIRESGECEPLLTTIDIPKYEMVHLALTLLLDRRKGLHREAVRIELPCRLLIRESCTYAPIP